jgi:hypothetical protein
MTTPENAKVGRDRTLAQLPSSILFDLARNESASREWRKAAVELMLDKNLPHVGSIELALLVHEIQLERMAKKEVAAVVESAIEEEFSSETPVASSIPTRLKSKVNRKIG